MRVCGGEGLHIQLLSGNPSAGAPTQPVKHLGDGIEITSCALKCFQHSALDKMLQCLQGKHFALGCLEQLAHVFAAYTEPTSIYAGNNLELRLALQAALATDFGQVLDASHLVSCRP